MHDGTILALDLASTSGVAEGRVGEKPRTWTWRLGSSGSSQAHRLAELLKLISNHLVVSKPQAIWVEAPMAPRVMVDIGATADTAGLLLGLPAIIRAVSYIRGVYTVNDANVQDVRKHFCGRRTFPKGEAKAAVIQRCKMLGWDVANDHEADAAALWSYACGQMNPRLAGALDPMFASADTFQSIGGAAGNVVAGLAERMARKGAA
jgi:hypothetical protein